MAGAFEKALVEIVHGGRQTGGDQRFLDDRLDKPFVFTRPSPAPIFHTTANQARRHSKLDQKDQSRLICQIH